MTPGPARGRIEAPQDDRRIAGTHAAPLAATPPVPLSAASAAAHRRQDEERDNHEEDKRAEPATAFGLACYAYTNDLGRAFRLNERLEYGMIGINSGLITTVEAPFGGVKESGLGKEGGSQGLEDYLETKYVCVDGI